PLPLDAVRRIGGVDPVDGVDAGGVFLADPREDALRAGALDAHRDAELLLEYLSHALREGEGHGGVERELALPPCGVYHSRRDRLGRRRRRLDRRGEHGETQRGRTLQDVAAGQAFHGVPPWFPARRCATPSWWTKGRAGCCCPGC